LDKVETRDGIPIGEADIRAVLGRSSIPPSTPAARADVDLATREVGSAAAAGLKKRWALAARNAATPIVTDLHDALDRAVFSTPLRARAPLWWRVVDVIQWLLALAATAGLVWYVALTAAGWLRFTVPDVPRWGAVPYPFLLLAGGLLGGLLVTAAARVLSRAGAKRRRALIDRRLRESIAAVAESQVIEPVAQVLARHRVVREQLDLAGRASR
jgi:hypothetical protein